MFLQSAVILMGSPGCGKTTVGEMLARKLDREAIDMDNHVLEGYWGMTVARKVSLNFILSCTACILR